MRILAVSDVPSALYYDNYQPGCLDGFDLILSCGDLRRNYLEFLVTMARCPLIYVPGNHDDAFLKDPPEGCLCADGLGGSYKYKPGQCMYTERQMARRVRHLALEMRLHKGFDILLTHAPARGLNDFDTLPHRGFACFNDLMDRYAPQYFVHGHIHRSYGPFIPQRTQRGGTTVINAFDHCIIEI